MFEANNDYALDRLKAILAVLDALIEQQMASRRQTVEGRAISQLVEDFKSTAWEYFELGRTLSPDGKKSVKSLTPEEYAYNLTQVLSQIERHTNLLCTLVRALPFPLAGASTGDLHAPAQLAAHIIDTVARRIPANDGTLVPVIDSAYKYIHFRYCDSVGVIGVPANQIVLPDWQISVLWHEIAGYALALMRRDDKLGAWIDDAQLDYYWNEADETLAALLKDDAELDLNLVKQEWLAQFFEDLFSAQAFGAAMEEILAEIFRRYKGPDYLAVADGGHPPGAHRLAVLRAYNQRQGSAPPDRETTPWADAIVDVYLRLIDQGDISHPMTDARELALANEVAVAFRTTVLRSSLVRSAGFIDAIAAVSMDESSDERAPKDPTAAKKVESVSDRSEPSDGAAHRSFKEEIRDCKTLDELLKVNFIRIDPAIPIGANGDGASGGAQRSGRR